MSAARPAAINLALGGTNVSTSPGAAVTVSQTGAVMTSGRLSPAVVLQSIGGGGGSAGVYVSAGAPLGAIGNVTLGGSGGTGNNGGAINATYSGGIQTTGNHSVGLLAQSIGAGGGEARLTDAGAGTVALGGTAGATGNGGAVSITQAGRIRTTGTNAHGVLLQSIGGGGGALFGTGLAAPTLRTANTGNGGAIGFTQTGDVIVTGAGAYGIIAQSLGGGGGWVDGVFNGSAGGTGQGGAVTLNVTGNVVASGANGIGVLAQSLGSSGGGNITATISGNVLGGSGTGAAISFDGGATNVLNIAGQVSAASNMAILGSSGSDTVNNTGFVIGNVQLARTGTTADLNRFNNQVGATFLSLDTIGLGPQGVLTNAGTITPGDVDVLQTSMLTGSFVQVPSGRFITDLDFSPTRYAQFTDRITATGSGTVGGTFVTVVKNVPVIQAGDRYSVLVDTGTGITNTGASLVAPVSAIARFSLVTTPTQLRLREQIDFAGVDRNFNRNRTEVGDYFNRIQAAGSSAALAPVITQLFYTPDVATLGLLYDTFDAEIYADQVAAAGYGADRFSHQLTDCRTQGLGIGNGCVWMSYDDNQLAQAQSFESREYREGSGQVAGGISYKLGSTLDLSLAASHESTESEKAGASGTGSRYQLGGALTLTNPFADLAVLATFGQAEMDVQRTVQIPTGPALTFAQQQFDYGQYAGAISRSFKVGTGRVKAALQGGYTWWSQKQVTETGASMLSLTLQDRGTEGFAYVNPSVEASHGLVRGVDLVLRGSYIHRFGEASVAAKFVGAPQVVQPFVTTAWFDRDAAQFGAQVNVKVSEDVSFRFGYDGQYGGRTTNHNVGGGIHLAF